MDNNKYDLEKYSNQYSEKKFQSKIAQITKKAGAKIVYAAFLLFYALKDKNFPITKKAKVLGALGYFILPIDLIPDAIPILGFSDDLAAIVYILSTVWEHITPEVRQQALDRVNSIFGEVEDKELQLF
ncbi:YkvA family protein [Bacteroides sp. 224]|uniref:YkvA family protein n=1 Tax=Bacteroides sp. 224 TaxID=2302936 RepID=UPI0013D4B5E1|nr:YkvA family protein [Bacteroides sp. 224]NDV66820.1 DUF1232 domain-containing protein [Bacteroides sp. 224]